MKLSARSNGHTSNHGTLFIYTTINEEHLADGAIRAALVRWSRPLLLYIRRGRVCCHIRIVGRGIASWDGHRNGHGHRDGRCSWSRLHVVRSDARTGFSQSNRRTLFVFWKPHKMMRLNAPWGALCLMLALATEPSFAFLPFAAPAHFKAHGGRIGTRMRPALRMVSLTDRVFPASDAQGVRGKFLGV